MLDPAKFCDLLHSVEWEEGLSYETSQAVESYLAKGKDGQLGITGEGLLLENAKGLTLFQKILILINRNLKIWQKETNIAASKSADPYGPKGITISGARYASEDAATLVHYVTAILEYSRSCGPLRVAREKVEMIKQEQADYERKKLEKENEVWYFYF